MSDTQHTPGPWFVETQSEDNVEDDDSHEVYVCHPSTECDATVVATMCRSHFVDIEQKQADAKLMAAAPELLDALEDLLMHCGIADAAPEDKDEIDHRYESAARKAIAKARGEV